MFVTVSQLNMFKVCVLLFAAFAVAISQAVDYTGHKVLRVVPKNEKELNFLQKLRSDYNVDFWNEPRILNNPVLFRLEPGMVKPVEDILAKKRIEHEVVFYDLQSTIAAEKVMHSPTNVSHSEAFDFGKYNQYNDIVALLVELSTKFPKIAKLETIGKTYENRPIYNLKISSGSSSDKPAIMMECGIHAREWSSVAAGAYLVNKLVTSYGSDSEVTSLVDKYEFNIVVESNPDGYIYTWTQDRLWRKTRSHSNMDWLGVCRGADANRNFDIEHCGVGTSRKPCEDIYCGDKPFSEGESRALRDLMVKLGSRLKAYFSIHAFSQLWMTPYGTTKKLPPNYNELVRIAKAGTTALAKKYGTTYSVGSISNIIYEAAGSSVDYAYVKKDVKIAFALELRDQGRFGFFLPKHLIIPMCEETFDGLAGAIKALA